MADTKTYHLECPYCAEEFDNPMTPEELIDGGELITCPECDEELEWEYDTASDTLELIDDLEGDEEESDMPLTDDEADEEGEGDE